MIKNLRDGFAAGRQIKESEAGEPLTEGKVNDEHRAGQQHHQDNPFIFMILTKYLVSKMSDLNGSSSLSFELWHKSKTKTR